MHNDRIVIQNIEEAVKDKDIKNSGAYHDVPNNSDNLHA